jgi:hypothetical protein
LYYSSLFLCSLFVLFFPFLFAQGPDTHINGAPGFLHLGIVYSVSVDCRKCANSKGA